LRHIGKLLIKRHWYGIKHSKTWQLLREIVLFISNALGKPLWKKDEKSPGKPWIF
jgi:hypothetical protein